MIKRIRALVDHVLIRVNENRNRDLYWESLRAKENSAYNEALLQENIMQSTRRFLGFEAKQIDYLINNTLKRFYYADVSNCKKIERIKLNLQILHSAKNLIIVRENLLNNGNNGFSFILDKAA